MRCLWIMRAVLLVVVLAGCAAPIAAPAPASQPRRALGPAFVVPGEAMEFRVRIRGIPIGLVQTAVGRGGWVGGRDAMILRSRGSSSGLLALFTQLTWELKTTIDMRRTLPIENLEEATLVLGDSTEHERDADTWSDGDDHHDIHSAVVALRGWRSQPGVRARFEVRIAGAHITAELWEARREYLPAARTRAVRYDGIALEDTAFSIWISDDAMRVPVALESASPWGKIAIELVDYDPPRE